MRPGGEYLSPCLKMSKWGLEARTWGLEVSTPGQEVSTRELAWSWIYLLACRLVDAWSVGEYLLFCLEVRTSCLEMSSRGREVSTMGLDWRWVQYLFSLSISNWPGIRYLSPCLTMSTLGLEVYTWNLALVSTQGMVSTWGRAGGEYYRYLRSELEVSTKGMVSTRDLAEGVP